MEQRDYARVYWRGRILGLMLVNRKSRNFFLHAVTLLTLLKYKGEPRLIKRKEQEPEKISTRNPGDIIGAITRGPSEVIIELTFGEAERRAIINRETKEIKNFIDRQSYRIPTVEFDEYLKSIQVMLEQEKDFDALWTDSRATISEFYFDRDNNPEVVDEGVPESMAE